MSNRTIQVTDSVYDYIQRISVREAGILTRLREETAQMGSIKAMQIAPEQGQFMALLAELTGAMHYLEVGVFTGYSTLAVAMAMPPDARITACDINPDWTAMGRRYWEEAGVAEKIDLRLRPAADTLRHLLAEGQANHYDLMFIDADKEGYDAYYELGLQLVRPGGLIMIDNVLWGGSVVNREDQDADTVAIRALNAKLHTDNRVSLSLVPIGDGLTLARRRF